VPPNRCTSRREIVLERDVLYQRIVVHNFDLGPIEVDVTLAFDADFADMFEVRGTRAREARQALEPLLSPQRPPLSYEGLRTVACADRDRRRAAAARCAGQSFVFHSLVGPRQDRQVLARVRPVLEPRAPVSTSNGEKHAKPALCLPRRVHDAPHPRGFAHVPRLETNHDGLNRILARAVRDLVTMLSETSEGSIPTRHSLVLRAFWTRRLDHGAAAIAVDARGRARLCCLSARHQATDFDDFTDREPGKIFHERGTGENGGAARDSRSSRTTARWMRHRSSCVAGRVRAHDARPSCCSSVWAERAAALD
jgi:hypothetical protein